MILSFQTDIPGQTVQTKIRLLIRVYTVCHSVCIVWTHYSMVEPHSSNFRVITTNIFGLQIFRKFGVASLWLNDVHCAVNSLILKINENCFQSGDNKHTKTLYEHHREYTAGKMLSIFSFSLFLCILYL